jgi:hypothetical protein
MCAYIGVCNTISSFTIAYHIISSWVGAGSHLIRHEAFGHSWMWICPLCDYMLYPIGKGGGGSGITYKTKNFQWLLENSCLMISHSACKASSEKYSLFSGMITSARILMGAPLACLTCLFCGANREATGAVLALDLLGLFEGACETHVILTPGACGRGGPSSTS